MKDYNRTKHKINTLYNDINELKNELLVLQTKEIKQNKKLDYNTLNTAKAIYYIKSPWINLEIQDTSGGNGWVYNYVYTIVNFPLFLVPYIKHSIFYQSLDENIWFDRNYFFVYVSEVDFNKEITQQKTTIKIVGQILASSYSTIQQPGLKVQIVIALTNPANYT